MSAFAFSFDLSVTFLEIQMSSLVAIEPILDIFDPNANADVPCEQGLRNELTALWK